MSEIRDAIETMSDLKAEFVKAGIYSTKRSISASAMEGTANFPMLVEDSISIDDGITISRAAEKKYASFLLTVLTMDPFLEVEKGQTPTAKDYLNQFHQNTRVRDANKGFHMNLVDFVKEAYDCDMEYVTMESEAFRMACAIYEGVTRSVPQDRNIALNYTIEEVTTPGTLNSRFLMETKGPKPISFDGATVNLKNSNNGVINVPNATKIDNADQVINIKPGKIDVNNEYQHDIHVNIPKEKDKPVQPKMTVRDRGNQWKTLTDNDCKKANDLVPTLLHVRVYPIDKYTREELTPIDFVMGVKATLHPMPLTEIARMVVSGMRNENIVFNFIRWTTGEISFFKDFLFAIDSIKMDAKDAGRDVTGWRPALKRRKNASRMKFRLSKNSIMPNASLVISQSGIDYIKDTYGYDLSNEMIINRMMDTYFLLGYIVVNSVNQRVTFKFDGIDATETYTFDTLKKENQSDDKAFKNMMKMLGRSM